MSTHEYSPVRHTHTAPVIRTAWADQRVWFTCATGHRGTPGCTRFRAWLRVTEIEFVKMNFHSTNSIFSDLSSTLDHKLRQTHSESVHLYTRAGWFYRLRLPRMGLENAVEFVRGFPSLQARFKSHTRRDF